MSTQEPYPQYPEPGTGPDQTAYGSPPAAAPAEQPQSIRTAVLLMRIGAAVSLLSLIVSLVTMGSLKDDIRDELTAQGTDFTDSDIDAVFGVAIAFAIVVGLIGVGLWLWMAWANGRGKKWARVISTVLAALGLIFLLLSLNSAGTTTLAGLFSLVTVALGVVAVVLLYRPDSSAFYAANSRR